ncbi:MAG: HDOD domain-containing protein [Nitrospirae bacterium]|nr:MAG: HDOD domain-containing protein [Nitrospirota bacterium]
MKHPEPHSFPQPRHDRTKRGPPMNQTSDLLTNTSLRKLIGDMQTLPSLPSLYRELMNILQADDASVEKAARIIAKDVGMVTKILQVVNSPFYGLRGKVSNPSQAVTLLGLNTIKSLVLSRKVFSQFDQSKIPFFSLEVLWQHGMTTGVHARAIAKEEAVEQAMTEDAFTAGMLHDVGTLVLASNLPDQYTEMLALMQEQGLSEWDAERRLFGATHAEVGGFLLGQWSLSQTIVDTVAYHHEPSHCPTPSSIVLASVHVANATEEETQASAIGEPVHPMDLTYLTDCGFADRLPLWQALCRDESLSKAGG